LTKLLDAAAMKMMQSREHPSCPRLFCVGNSGRAIRDTHQIPIVWVEGGLISADRQARALIDTLSVDIE
jgi:hypothetical protein